MTRKQIARRAFSPEHKRLMLAYHGARGGARTAAWKALRDLVAADMKKRRRR